MSASTASQAFCPICKDSSDNWVSVQWKGAKGINEANVKRKDDLVVETNTSIKTLVNSTSMIKTLKAILQRHKTINFKGL